MPNRLALSTSPYLLQHRDNPVDWYPWGPEALAKAADDDKPIFLSIGYSACHWCHVMERESFEDPAIAAILNEFFVSIKVDREQRPDLDHIYMQIVQWMSGSGGWPMSVFLTPSQKPFFAGTYLPPVDSHGRPGFPSVLRVVADAWQNQREMVTRQASSLTEKLRQASASFGGGEGEFTGDDAQAAGVAADAALHAAFDPLHGGFGSPPKFPHAIELQLLLRIQHRAPTADRSRVIRESLDAMAAGGIRDHLGGGFARYSTDRQWLVPHFEKMLYDNALLAGLYCDAWRWCGDEGYRQVARATCDFVLREFPDTSGGFSSQGAESPETFQGFCSAQDADTDGQEGKFYVWSAEEIGDALGEDAAAFAAAYGVTAEGNFEGRNVLHLPRPLAETAAALGQDADDFEARMARCRHRLLDARNKRLRPGTDDKVLLGWNALMIDSLSKAGAAFDEPRYLEAAAAAVRFIDREMGGADFELKHAWRHGVAEVDAFLDDYAAMCNALITLWEATGRGEYLGRAVRCADAMLERFSSDGGAFYYTAGQAEPLVSRHVDSFDGSTPSGNSLAATALVRLANWTGRENFRRHAARCFAAFTQQLRHQPGAMNQMVLAADAWSQPPQHWTLEAADASIGWHLRQRFFSVYRGGAMLLVTDRSGRSEPPPQGLHGAFQHGDQDDHGEPSGAPECRLYVCENFLCAAPIDGLAAVETFMKD